MTKDEFRRILRAEPFRPFAVQLPSGREVFVNHQEFVLLTGGRTVIIASSHDNSFDVIDLMLVQNIRVPATNESAHQ